MTIRQYKKNYYICKDDFDKMIYVGDTVEVFLPLEAKPYKSTVYWNRVSGAYINSHPAHIKMGHSKHRMLIDFFRCNQSPVPIYDSYDNDAKPTIHHGYVKKVKSFYE